MVPRPRATSTTHRASRAIALAAPFLVALGLCASAHAQLFENPDWKESDVPPPPAFDLKRVLEIEMPRYMTLRFGIDPATIAITPDGVVRYVVIARSEGAGGAVNAFYDALRCATAESKTYARFSGGSWQPVSNPEWKRIDTLNSRYTIELAKQVICQSQAPRASVADMVKNLKKPLLY